MASSSLGALMIDEGLISEDQLEAGLAAQRARGGRIGEALVSLGILTDAQVMWALARQLDIPYIPRIDTRPEALDLLAVAKLPGGLAHQLGAFPLLMGEDSLTVVMEDPLNALGVKVIERVCGLRVKVALSEQAELRRALAQVYRDGAGERVTTSVTGWGLGPERRADLLADESGRALLDWLVAEARLRGAVDLRFFATEAGGEVRIGLGPGARGEGAVFLSRPWYAQLLSWVRGMPQAAGLVRLVDGVHGQSAVVDLLPSVPPAVEVEGAAIVAALRPGLVVVAHPDAAVRDEAVVALCRALASADAEVFALPEAPAPDGATRLRRDTEVDEPRMVLRALAFNPQVLVLSEDAGWCLPAALRRGRPESWIIQPWAGPDAAAALTDLRGAGVPAGNLGAGLAGVLEVRGDGRQRGPRAPLKAVFAQADDELRAALLRDDVAALLRWRRERDDQSEGGDAPRSASA